MVGLFRVDIPVRDMARAVKFYSTIFEVDIRVVDVAGQTYQIAETGGRYQLGMLIQEAHYRVTLSSLHYWEPTYTRGPLVCLTVFDKDLKTIIDKVEPAGGQILTPICPFLPSLKYGYNAIIKDTEGNRIAIQSNVTSSCELDASQPLPDEIVEVLMYRESYP